MSTPKINRLDAREVLKRIEELGSVYLPAWRPQEGEPGWAVARIYAMMHDALGSEADALLQKLFIAYLDELGFRQAPANAAAAPVVFELSKNFKGSVNIPKGTALESDTKVRYETERDFTAVSAKISAVLDVNPVRNEVTDVAESLLSKKGATLFEEGEAASQYIYFGDDELFRIHRFAGDTDAYLEYIVPFRGAAKWEYWGEAPGDPEPEWKPFISAGNDLNKRGNTATVKRKIADIESYWIRAKLDGAVERISDYAVSFKSRSGVDALYHNDVAIDPYRTIYPFGRLPQRNDSFYIASSEAFSKRGAVAGMDFVGSDIAVEADGSVKFGTGIVTLEYFNGSSWKPLRAVQYGTLGLEAERECDLSFRIPFDIAETSVNGDKNLWIRCRLVGGSYTCTDGVAGVSFSIPSFDTIDIYVKEFSRRPRYLFREAHGSFEDLVASGGWREPYSVVAAEKAVYVGFDAPFEEAGAISLFFMPKEAADTPKRVLEWSYSSAEGWSPLPVEDGTNGFVQRGFVQFIAPPAQSKRKHFGKELYWLKIEFPFEANNVEAEGIYLNCVPATQSVSVENEILGSSDGSASQRFTLAHSPAFEQQVWVLEPKRPASGSWVEDSFGEGYRVLWEPVEDLDLVEADARCYSFDSYTGEILFGDGVHGMIPPIAKNGITASYRYGGGSAGNVSAGKITKLAETISYIDKVYNPVPAEGGADAQSLESLMRTGPLRIKHRYRAVRREDYAALVIESSSDVAKVEVVPGGGRVDLFILPYGGEAKPVPSLKLIKRIEEYIGSHAPATAQIDISPPLYVPVDVDIELITGDWSLAARIRHALTKAIDAFLHPLEGGRESDGWEFSEAPAVSDIISLAGGVEGVDGIVSLKISFDLPGGDMAELSLGENETIEFEPGWMVCSGEHTIRVRGV